ncbi:MAG TPA: M23 family metallopeptidase [Firmicutes bacterium]|jgi:murein DD-endopeptidase MepM/ murein hydrolase activator NlpD|nr:M23 family metallopeptidase [Bacillota bacterium]
MAWRHDRQEYRTRWQPEPLSKAPLPGWAWQTLVALMIFFLILGASRSNLTAAEDLVAMAKEAVDEDITYDEVKAWIANLPEIVSRVAAFDIERFWARGVVGRQSSLIWPCEGEVVSYFGWRTNEDSQGMSLHQGIDIAAEEGSDVVAVAEGMVTSVRQSDSYGLTVEIEHSQGFSSVYAHLGTVSVMKDQKVKQGEVIGTVGKTGNATGPHLHFEIRKEGLEIDPLTLLPPRPEIQ